MTVEIVDRQGVKSRAEGVFTLDGTPARATGSLDVDVASFTMPSRHVLVMGAGNIPATRVNAWTRK